MSSERLLRYQEAAQKFGGVSCKTVRRMVAAGTLPQPVYVGRTPMLCESEVNAAIERLKQERKDSYGRNSL